MIILEGLAIVGICVGVYSIKILSNRMGYKISKKRLKKLLIKGFELMDIDLIKNVIASLEDFDNKNKTKKLDKYLLDIVQGFKIRDDLPNLNEEIILSRPKDIRLNNVLENKKVELKEKRNNIIERKNAIRQKQIKLNKNNKNRISGSLG